MTLVLPILDPIASAMAVARRAARMVAVEFVVPAVVGARYAELVAEFVSWVPLSMDRRTDGSHVITVWLEQGRSWRYQFLIDDERWINDWSADHYVDCDAGCFAVVDT